MTNVVFVVSRAALVCVEPVGGGEGDFLKPCLQTDPADCFPFTASSLERIKKGLVLVSFASHGERGAFPWGNNQGINWGEESNVRCVMTNAPGAHHLSAGLIKRYKLLQVWSCASPAAVATSHAWGIHTLFKLGLLKLHQVKTLPGFLTSNPFVELE